MSGTVDGPDTRLGGTQAVRLVAEREMRTRLGSKAFRITTVVMVLLVVGFALVMKLVGSQDSAKHIGLTGSAAPLTARVQALSESLGKPLRTVRVADESAGRRMVADGRLDALVVGAQGPRLRVVVDEKLDDQLRATLTSVAGQSALDEQIVRLGGDPADVAAQVRQASVAVTALEPSPNYDPQRLAVGSVAGILIYLALLATGQSVAQGVVEEKSSRVVELLLATIRPWQLMAGKVIGIGLVGLLQLAVVGVAGALAGKLTGSLSLSLSATAGAVTWLVVWFVLGFTLYSLVFAGLGALVSRQEDVGGVIAPATMLLVVGYVVGISVLPSAPGNPAVSAMSLLPVFSPTLMPMRLAMGSVPLWQTLVSLGLALATVPVLVAVAGRIYRNGVVRTGARVGLREAMRG
jgi:ABC-2 type transport system permease protein